MGKLDYLATGQIKTRMCLRIMATTDLHMQILPFNYLTGQPNIAQGLAQTASLIRHARTEISNTLLLDNGDFLCGTTTGFDNTATWKTRHPMIEIMNHLGYDAATLGNHDFDHGLPFLRAITNQASFPFVSANAVAHKGGSADTDTSIFQRFTILKRQFCDKSGVQRGLNIGVTGFLPPNMLADHSDNAQALQTRDILEAARCVIPQMKAAGADIIIALAHSGFGPETHSPDMENAVIPLAELDGIDAIICGHRHQVFPGPNGPTARNIDKKLGLVHGKPVVSAGHWGSHLGLIDLDLSLENGTWTIAKTRSEARPVFSRSANGQLTASVRSDEKVSDIIAPMHQRIVRRMRQPIGSVTRPLNSFHAFAAPSRAVQVIQRAQIWYVTQTLSAPELRNLQPLLSSACSFKTGGLGGPENFTDIRPGPVTVRDISDLYPFINQIGLVRITGQGLRDWLERSASLYNQIMPGAETDLKPTATPGYFIESVLGADYSIDLSAPARFDITGQRINPEARRIKNLRVQGQLVEDDHAFVMITNNFRINGGGAYPQSSLSSRLDFPATPLPDILTSYFKAHPDLDPPLDPHWRFAPVRGARARFRSSPNVQPDATGFTDLGPDANGFQILSLSL
ncbi:MAG TPA: bifunctional 2',3'-cyclic-nucleotide 2'-phosphodiesterase/3'-nucleotidase [Aliiroseovarius sp.]|nr:bifunctional 2',3'-cyclic-nucleotide 2'-phosphodiesterase/3'-nucleotidase [Aliiroseovarius sp.]